MILLRSFLFNVLFYVNFAAQMIVFAPVFFLASEETCWRIVKNWARSNLWLLRHVAGTRSHVIGLENVPAGSFIIASKHQSFWDVFALLPDLDRPTFILKKELLRIPLFGSYARKMGMIGVDRAKRGGAIASMLEESRKAVEEGRQIFIFPEGTRTAPGQAIEYRHGVYRLYEALGLEVVPVALNSGLYWRRRSFRRNPGTITAEILPPIKPGLERQDFLERLRSAIETHSHALLEEAVERDGVSPPSVRVKREAAASRSL